MKSKPNLSVLTSERNSTGSGNVRVADYNRMVETVPCPVPSEIIETDELIREYLSPRRLKEITGLEDLNDVTTLEMRVDTRDISLGNFGIYVPQLEELKLNHSHVDNLRDLGSSLENLRILNMNHCGLQSLDGIHSLSNLQELYLAYNRISDLTPCSMLEKLETLDIESNEISEMSQLDFLSMCQSLRHLTIRGNPVCNCVSGENADSVGNYQWTVKQLMPQLATLDDLAASDITPDMTVSDCDAELQQHRQFVADKQDSMLSLSESFNAGKPSPDDSVDDALLESVDTDGVRQPYFDEEPEWSRQTTQTTSIDSRSPPSETPDSAFDSHSNERPQGRPQSARVPSYERRLAASWCRPKTAASGSRPLGRMLKPSCDWLKLDRRAGPNDAPADTEEAAPIGSALTSGATVCGNPGFALRRRRKMTEQTVSAASSSSLASAVSPRCSFSTDSNAKSSSTDEEAFAVMPMIPRPPRTQNPRTAAAFASGVTKSVTVTSCGNR